MTPPPAARAPPLVGQGEEKKVCCSRADGDQVLDARDAGHLPGDAFGLLALGPRSNGAAQRHGTAVGFDGYAIGIELGVAAKGFFDLAPDLHRRNARVNTLCWE